MEKVLRKFDENKIIIGFVIIMIIITAYAGTKQKNVESINSTNIVAFNK